MKAMYMKEMDFFFFLGSGYAYLSVMRMGRLAVEAGVDVRWRPFNVRTVMAENNIALRTQTAKVAYLWRDIERRAAVHGLPFTTAPQWPTDPDLLANRVAALAAMEGWCASYTLESFRAWFLEGVALGSREHLEHVLGSLGRDVDAVVAEANSPRALDSLVSETNLARSYGIFGSPAFVVDGEAFWGDDRLEEAMLWASGRHPAQMAQHSGCLSS